MREDEGFGGGPRFAERLSFQAGPRRPAPARADGRPVVRLTAQGTPVAAAGVGAWRRAAAGPPDAAPVASGTRAVPWRG
jgi:hypothetical protein